MGIRIETDCAVRAQAPENGETFSLKELQEVVKGCIELVHMKDGRIMVVNDEGLLRNLDPNPIATLIVGQLIVGDVIVVERKEIE